MTLQCQDNYKIQYKNSSKSRDFRTRNRPPVARRRSPACYRVSTTNKERHKADTQNKAMKRRAACERVPTITRGQRAYTLFMAKYRPAY